MVSEAFRDDTKLILLLTVDCFRYDYSMRMCKYTNKFFQHFGNIYKNVYTHGAGTPAAFPAIMTSTYPLMYSRYPHLGYVRLSISEVLRMNGFFNIALVPNPFLSKYYGYDRGFNVHFDYLPTRKIERIFLAANGVRQLGLEISSVNPFARYAQAVSPYVKGYLLLGLLRYVLKKFSEKAYSRRLFVWIHFMDSHIPWYPPKVKESLISSISNALNIQYSVDIKRLYEETYNEVDQYIVDLIELLQTFKLLNKTLIIMTSDHGEELREEQAVGHPPMHSDRILHVPLYVYPRLVESATYIDSLRGLIDLASSIVKLFGINKLTRMPWYGSPVIFSDEEKEYIIAETGHKSGSRALDEKYTKYSVITKDRIVTYKPADNLIMVRDRKSDKIIDVSRDGNSGEFREYISIIDRHIKLEKRTQLIERVRRSLRRRR